MPLCRGCGVDFNRHQLSRRNLCHTCSYQRIVESIQQMRAQQGVYYERWHEGFERGMNRVWGSRGKDNL